MPQPLRSFYRQIVGPDAIPWREWRHLAAMPRFVPGTTRIAGRTVEFVDAASVVSAVTSIFGAGCYDLPADARGDLVLDCGANIGLSILRWKVSDPTVRVVAFEPDPIVFATLERNIRTWGFKRVELRQEAVWTDDGSVSFRPDGADAGRLAPGAGNATIEVETTRLHNHLHGPIALLKMDIEGSETEVLLDCRDRLHHVDRVFLEYHSYVDQVQRLDELLAVLRAAGMRTHLSSEFSAARPFLDIPTDIGMDNRVNVFAWRESGQRSQRRYSR